MLGEAMHVVPPSRPPTSSSRSSPRRRRPRPIADIHEADHIVQTMKYLAQIQSETQAISDNYHEKPIDIDAAFLEIDVADNENGGDSYKTNRHVKKPEKKSKSGKVGTASDAMADMTNNRRKAISYIESSLSSRHTKFRKNTKTKLCFGSKLLWPECFVDAEVDGKYHIKFDEVELRFANADAQKSFEDWSNLSKGSSVQPFHAVNGGSLCREQEFFCSDASHIGPESEENRKFTARVIPKGTAVIITTLLELGEQVVIGGEGEHAGKQGEVKKVHYEEAEYQVDDIVRVMKGRTRGDRGKVTKYEKEKGNVHVEFTQGNELVKSSILNKEEYEVHLEDGTVYKTTDGASNVHKQGLAAEHSGQKGQLDQVCNRLHAKNKYAVALSGTGERKVFSGRHIELLTTHEFVVEFQSPTAPKEWVTIRAEVTRPKRKLTDPLFALVATTEPVSRESLLRPPLLLTGALGCGKSVLCKQYAHAVAARGLRLRECPIGVGDYVRVVKGSPKVGRSGRVVRAKDVDGDFHVRFDDADWEVLNEANLERTHYHKDEILVQVPLLVTATDLEAAIQKHPSSVTPDDDILRIYLETCMPEMAPALLRARSYGQLLVMLDGVENFGEMRDVFYDYIRNRLLAETKLCLTAVAEYFKQKDPFQSFFVHLRARPLSAEQQGQLLRIRLRVSPEPEGGAGADTPLPEREELLAKKLSALTATHGSLFETPLLLNMLVSEYLSAERTKGKEGMRSWATLTRSAVYQPAIDTVILQSFQQKLPATTSLAAINDFLQYLAFTLTSRENAGQVRFFDEDFVQSEVLDSKRGRPELKEVWDLLRPLISDYLFPLIEKEEFNFFIKDLPFQEFFAAKHIIKQLEQSPKQASEEFSELFLGEKPKGTLERFLETPKYQRVVQLVQEGLMREHDPDDEDDAHGGLPRLFAFSFFAEKIKQEHVEQLEREADGDDDAAATNDHAHDLSNNTSVLLKLEGSLDSSEAGRTLATLLSGFKGDKLRLQLGRSKLGADGVAGLDHAMAQWAHLLSMITELDLSHNGATGPFPEAIYRLLFTLDRYDLAGNRFDVDSCSLQAALMGGFKHLRDIPELNLRQRKLTGALPSFRCCTFMTHVYLEQNNLTGPVPSFKGCDALEVLWLHDNKLSGALPSFNCCPNLKSLRLENNGGVGEIPSFDQCFGLTTLKLGQNQFTGAVPDFSSNRMLQVLDVSFNRCSGALPPFEQCVNLVRLDLSGNQLEGPCPYFGNCLKLKFLEIANNNLTGAMPDFSPCKQLTILDLGFNDLDGPLPDLSSLNLEALFLNNNEGLTPVKSTQNKRGSISGVIPQDKIRRRNTQTEMTFELVPRTAPYRSRHGEEISSDF